MGLDQYLRGEKLHWQRKDETDRQEDGFRVFEVIIDLGYWRKHPDLHKFMVESFAGGVYKSRMSVELSEIDMRNTISAIKERRLPPKEAEEGFFWGNSDLSDEGVAEDIRIFETAIEWLKGGDESPIMEEPSKLAEKLHEQSGGRLTATSFKLRDTDKKDQFVTRSVVYSADW